MGVYIPDSLPQDKVKDIPVPQTKPIQVQQPNEPQLKKKPPINSKLMKGMPKDTKPQNCIVVGGKVVELKPTKLKYFRNRMASIYTVLKVIPLNEFLAYEKGTFDEERDSDQILYDFLVAVFDDSTIVRSNYDNMTAEDIQNILEIFGRINHIDEKEEKARKNKQTQMTH